MLKIAHRGASGYEPENTIRAFRRALELGAKMLEFDVHLSKEGEVMIIHDETLERTTNGQGRVSEKTKEELQKMDAGQGEEIPTLKEALNFIDKKAGVNIELKGAGTGKKVARMLPEYIAKGWKVEDFWISAERQEELKEFQELLPGINFALVFHKEADYLSEAEKMDIHSINLNKKLIDMEIVGQAHQKNIKVMAFVVNEQNEAKRLEKMSVDGIFTNYLDKI
jgi:glycerophosphoryl diester phosphodiesterase